MRHIIVLAFIAAILLRPGNTKGDFICGEPFLVPNVSSDYDDTYVRIAADGLSLYITSYRPGGYGERDLWVAQRSTKNDEWGTPVNLGPKVNSRGWDACASISTDNLALYFYSQDRPGGYGGLDLWVSTRETTEDDWGDAVNLGPPFNSAGHEWAPYISADNLSLYFACDWSGGSGSVDMWMSARETTHDDWGTPVNLGSTVNWWGWDCKTDISADGRTLFFTRREPPSEDYDIWVTRRATIHNDWGTPVPLPINTSYAEASQSISANGSILYFVSNRPATPGGVDIWQAPIEPVVDLNGDGVVNAVDLCIMVDHWGKNYPLCDIGPTPLGDGIVDVQDLIVLSEHLFEDYRIMAHWMLDETEDNVAFDSIHGNDGTLNGDPMWQPAQGQVNGALQFDGEGGYVSTPFILDPTAGPFSVFAWIKGDEAGRIILSQAGSYCDWLATDSTGKLKTDLPYPLPALESDWVITDDIWHQIGLVCDTASTILYMDGAEVVRNNFSPIMPAQGGLYIGAGKDLEPGTFWSGLIDDIRIYSVALSAEEIEALAR